MEKTSMTNLKCPMCSKPYVARVARVGLAERMLSWFYIYPFKCQLCGCRFKSLQWGIRYFRVEEDRREYERLPAAFAVSFSSETFDGKGIACEISMSGCTFETETGASQPKAGSILRLVLQFSNVPQAVNVEAVVRNLRQRRVGVEFLRFSPSDKDRLQQYVRDLLARRDADVRKSEHQVVGQRASVHL